MPDDVHSVAAACLRHSGQRYTTNRRTVVDILATTERPLTIPEMLNEQAGLAQSSVYRTLAVLEQAGVAKRLAGAGDFARYELADRLSDHHHHLICTGCGAMIDFTVPVPVEQALAKAIERVSDDTGFVTEHHRLDLLGTCPDCR